MDQAAQGTDELHALGMLEHVAAHGKVQNLGEDIMKECYPVSVRGPPAMTTGTQQPAMTSAKESMSPV